MEFNELSRAEKIKYWTEIESDINQCLDLCGRDVTCEVSKDIKEYLAHNELGLSIELLVNAAIEDDWEIQANAKRKILETLIKMGYPKTDVEEFRQYESWLNS